MAGIMDFLKDELAKAKRSYGLLSGIPKTFKNNPANTATIDSILGLTGGVPGLGDLQAGVMAADDFSNGRYLSGALNGVGVLPMIPAIGGMVAKKAGDMPTGWIDGWKTRVEQPYLEGPQPPKRPRDTWGGYSTPEEYQAAQAAKQIADAEWAARASQAQRDILNGASRSPYQKGDPAYKVNDRISQDVSPYLNDRPSNALGQEIPLTQYELAHQTAQRNATLPVEQGGLGLPEGNTAMDRARAMGFDTDAYHGTRTEGIEALDPDIAKYAREGAGTWLTPNTERANSYAGTLGGYVMPLKIDPRDMARMDFEGKNWASAPEKQPIFNATGKKSYPSRYFDDPYDLTTNDYSVMAKARGNSGLIIDNVKDAGGYGAGVSASSMPTTGTSIALHDPTKARSRFAAFDPMKRDSADLLASFGVPVASSALLAALLANPQEAQAK